MCRLGTTGGIASRSAVDGPLPVCPQEAKIKLRTSKQASRQSEFHRSSYEQGTRDAAQIDINQRSLTTRDSKDGVKE